MLQSFADFMAYRVFGLTPQSHLGGAVDFFIYDTIKIFIMLAGNYFSSIHYTELFPS